MNLSWVGGGALGLGATARLPFPKHARHAGGSIVMDAPDYDSVEELKRKAGYVPPGALEKLTVARSAELERKDRCAQRTPESP